MRKKIFTLLTLMLAVCSGAWATDYVFCDANKNALTTNGSWVFTDGGKTWTMICGSEKYATGSSDKSDYLKMNRNKTWTVAIPEGLRVTKFKVQGWQNATTDTPSTNISNVNGTDVDYALPLSNAAEASYTYNFSTAATGSFTFTISGDKQVLVKFTITAEVIPAGPSISTSGTTSVAATESGVAATTDIAITGYNLTTNGTLTAEFTSSVSGLSVSFGSNTTSIDADGAISTSVTVSYSSTVNVPRGTAYLRISDGTNSKNVAITYSASVTSWTLQSVNTTTTWDWSKITANTTSDKYSSEGIKLTAETTPSSTTEFVMANYDGIDYTIGSDFDGTSVAFKGEYPIRKNQFCQNGIVKINVAVPGKIVVKFSDTGSSASASAVKRYLVVNDEQTEYWTSRENNNSDPEIAYAAKMNVVSGEIAVPAGDVTITGSSAIIINYITFTPTAETVGTASGRNYASYVTTKKLDFASAEGITAYIATGFNGAKNAIVLKKVDVVPAGTAIIVKTDEKGGSTDVEVTTDDPSDVSENALVAGDGTTAWNGTANYTYYYLAGDQFHKATSGTLQSGKAYLKVLTSEVPASARDFGFVFEDDATGINMVQNSRITENGEYYNLNGQRIAQPTKGLYIVNGKKVIVK